MSFRPSGLGCEFTVSGLGTYLKIVNENKQFTYFLQSQHLYQYQICPWAHFPLLITLLFALSNSIGSFPFLKFSVMFVKHFPNNSIHLTLGIYLVSSVSPLTCDSKNAVQIMSRSDFIFNSRLEKSRHNTLVHYDIDSGNKIVSDVSHWAIDKSVRGRNARYSYLYWFMSLIPCSYHNSVVSLSRYK